MIRKYLETAITQRNPDGSIYKTDIIISIDLNTIDLSSALHCLHGLKHNGGSVRFADSETNSKIGGVSTDNKLQSGGYSHLNNLLNPEYFKDLENKTNNTVDQTAGVSNVDDNMLIDERVNCDILSSLLVN